MGIEVQSAIQFLIDFSSPLLVIVTTVYVILTYQILWKNDTQFKIMNRPYLGLICVEPKKIKENPPIGEQIIFKGTILNKGKTPCKLVALDVYVDENLMLHNSYLNNTIIMPEQEVKLSLAYVRLKAGAGTYDIKVLLQYMPSGWSQDKPFESIYEIRYTDLLRDMRYDESIMT